MDIAEAPARASQISLGIRANLAQFALLVGVNGLVGALVGQERSLVPLLGERVFAVGSSTALMLFIVSFGLAKAAANLAAGYLADRIGRKKVLLLGWALGVPVPIALMLAPGWSWVIAANVLLGINQGFAWSSTVVMKIDLAGPRQRGLAMGLNEFAGYLAVAISAAASGWLASRYGLRPEPLFLGLAIAGLGLGLSAFFVKDTSSHMELENGSAAGKRFAEVAALGSYRHRGLAAVSRTGLVNNANDALAWGLLPVLMLAQGLSTLQIGTIAAVYPAVWGVAQLATGAWSDRVGRRLPVAIGMWTQATALLWFWLADGFSQMVGAAVLLGLGTALTYPALLAAVGDLAAPSWRAAAVGVYRTWRDGGYVVGAITAGVLADLFSPGTALVIVAGLTALSGLDAWTNLGSSSDDLNTLG
ncbi:MAG: MFS transporter [Actinobacteria bacterium]|nr:MFS transporter [Actinomycetota bacterium]